MSLPLRKTHPLFKIMNNSLIDLPSPSNISLMWNMGSLMGLCLIIQVSSGLFLSLHYTADILMAFNSLAHICRDVNMGWLMRTIHANGASLFFIALYLHIARGIYYKSFTLHMTWMSGIILLLLTMVTAFLGYVLPWGQMSFWGGTVITNLLSAIPYLGKTLVQWIWGGFAVDNPTLTRFFSFHFLLPFILLAFIMIHFMFLHETGSSNPLGSASNMSKLSFHPYFSLKDLMGAIFSLIPFFIIILYSPYFLSDPENFLPANPLITPIHIQPEWYFLFAYAILRSIPNKLGGVIALIMSILVLFIFALNSPNMQSSSFNILAKKMFWVFSTIFILLTWIGARPVEMPYILIGQILTVMYFSYFPLTMLINKN